jgi:hypothetical protein
VRRAAAALLLSLLVVACREDVGRGPEAFDLPTLQAVLADAGYTCVTQAVDACDMDVGYAMTFPNRVHQQRALDDVADCRDDEGASAPVYLAAGQGWLVFAEGPRKAHDLADRTGAEAHTYCDGGFTEDARRWMVNHGWLGIFWLAFLAGAAWLARDQLRQRRPRDGRRSPVA